VDFSVSQSRLAHLIPSVNADAAHCPAGSQQVEVDAAAELIRGLQRGDRDALTTLVTLHQQRIHRLVRRLSGWSSDAEDLVQEVFIAAMRGAKKFDGRSSIETWLTRIAINTCRADRRRRLLRVKFWKSMMNHESILETTPQVETRETAERVVKCLRKLAGKYREVMVLRYLEEQSVAEIAKLLELSTGTVEVRLHRGRQMLRERLPDLASDQ
jgi:RNA polymerase sigma-70 factor (ECF subfamily)